VRQARRIPTALAGHGGCRHAGIREQGHLRTAPDEG
jgi:hypothetical protein